MRFCFLLVSSVIINQFGRHYSMFNLFISKTEMNRTLGIASEMNYVQDGVVNAYSSKFQYRVAMNITEMAFSWNSRSNDIHYSLRVGADDNTAVMPFTRLPHQGVVPRTTQHFDVEYRCIGSKAGQFGVTLSINFSRPYEQNQTSVVLRQQKICGPREGQHGKSGRTSDISILESNDAEEPIITADQIFYVAIGSVCCIFIVIGSLIVIYFKSAKKNLSVEPPIRYPVAHSSPGYLSQTQPFLRTDSPSINSKYSVVHNNGGSSMHVVSERRIAAPAPTPTSCSIAPSSFVQPIPVPIIEDQPVNIDIASALIDLSANRNCFEIGSIELEGTFGEMRWALWRLKTVSGAGGGARDDYEGGCDIDHEEEDDDARGGGVGEEVTMLVKTLKPTAERRQLEKFLSEALVFYGLPPHPHIAQVVAAATYGRFDRPHTVTDFPLICYEHSFGFGNLKKFLLRCRGEDGGRSVPNALRTQDIVSMAVQIVKAMVHLHRLGIIHKDIATRNCLISDEFAVQLCDNALSRDLFPSDYHCLGDNENRPVKWLAIEALDNNHFTSASDVWSYGVTMWELLSCGQQPYADIDPEEMSAYLHDGSRLAQPYGCPDELFGVMFCCWHHHHTSRPSFEQLLVALEDFLTQLMQFI